MADARTQAKDSTAAAGAKLQAIKPRNKQVEFRADQMMLAEEKRTQRVLYAPADMTVEQLTDDPARWAIFTSGPYRLNRFDRIEVIGGNEVAGRWWAEVLVTSTVIGAAQMHLLQAIKLPEPLEDTSDRLPAGYRFDEDPVKGLCIIRIRDGTEMGNQRDHGWRRREDAIRFLLDHASVRQGG